MKANEFVKKYGWELVIDLLNRGSKQTHVTNDARMLINAETYIKQCPWFADDINSAISLADLKRLIESHELVEQWGGLADAKVVVKISRHKKYLKKAIADVESCQ